MEKDDVHLSYLPLPHLFERAVYTILTFKGASIYFFSGDIMPYLTIWPPMATFMYVPTFGLILLLLVLLSHYWKKFNQNIGQEAKNLTSALKGQNKTQGNWGEMILESIFVLPEAEVSA